MGRLVVVSFRLGSTDGVSIEAAKWIGALRELGHHVTSVAGSGVADEIVPGLAIRDERPLDEHQLEAALKGADVVVVENMMSLPLNVAARDALSRILDERAALIHDHDLAWQRPEWRDEAAPVDRPWWRHVTINELSRQELAERAISATTIYNTFDITPPPGGREATRNDLEVSDERLLLHPSRAIPRKNVAGALQLAVELDATLWLLGPAEDGFEEELEHIVRGARVAVRRGALPNRDIHDAYAASDLVVMPSTWEGFGNPVLESVTHRRALAVYPYPVLEEIRSFGFQFFDLSDVEEIDRFLAAPDEAMWDNNLDIARAHFNVADLPARLAPLLESWDLN
jgi:glycosyltransferase involved in cell wall biosynthesis